MSEWGPEQEAAHPRMPKGHHGGGEWVRHVLSRLTGGAEVGHDIRGELDYEHLHSIRDFTHGDAQLKHIWQHQGFHAKPRVVSREEMDKLIADGWTELHRGIQSIRETMADTSRDDELAGRWAEQFRTGDHQYPGLGAYGNGTYTTTNRNMALRYAGRSSEDQGPIPGLLRMALNPDARVIDSGDLASMMVHDPSFQEQDATQIAERMRTHGVEQVVQDAEDRVRRARILGDEGRYASALGYDAIRVNAGAAGIYVILNRSAVAVEEAQ